MLIQIKKEVTMQYPRLLEILHHRLNKELPQVQKNPKLLNQSQHR
jgi:hypothetical protein